MHKPLFASIEETAAFARGLDTRALGKHINFSPQVSSTNDLALVAARAGAAHGTVFVADSQDTGRGRRGRTWECPPRLGLLFSAVIRPAKISPELSGWLPLAAGLACARAMSVVPLLANLSVKWPNDVVLPCAAEPGWRKLGGVLCESSLGNAGMRERGEMVLEYVVFGVGLNLNQRAAQLATTGKGTATSIFAQTGALVDRRTVFRRVLKQLEAALDRLSDRAQQKSLQNEIESGMAAWMARKRLRFHAPAGDKRERTGVFAGLDEFGRLRVKDECGESTFADAEIVGLGLE
ncbi:MAG TPA: biotin--[acetyl-CoA-carboxylase] ligase [Planctomycetota bacterium]|nr:biotin--[acetyl-CoA-carboxylase] ligase [Planctomycetota bacterium]